MILSGLVMLVPECIGCGFKVNGRSAEVSSRMQDILATSQEHFCLKSAKENLKLLSFLALFILCS